MEVKLPRPVGRPRKFPKADDDLSKSQSPVKNPPAALKRNSPRQSVAKSPSKSPSKTLPLYVMELPAVEPKYKCPECPYDTFKRSSFVAHAKAAHSRTYEVFYQCMGCKKQFEQMRECLGHTTSCRQIQKVADIQAEQEKRISRKRHLDSESLEHAAKPPSEKPSSLKLRLRISDPLSVVEPAPASSSSQGTSEENNQEEDLNEADESAEDQNESNLRSPKREQYLQLIPGVVKNPFKCPVCQRDIKRKDRLTTHCKREHNLELDYVYRCAHCLVDYDDWRSCQNHEKACSQRPAHEVSLNNSHLEAKVKPIRRHTGPQTTHLSLPSTSHSRSNGTHHHQRSTSHQNNTSNWEMLFFTELGRSLVNNPASADSLVRVVPILQKIVREVVTNLGHQS